MRFSRQLGILAALLLQSLPTFADEVITNVISPVVSFQYFNSLGEWGTTLVSPVVSFQYFDWPGDEVLQLLSSPPVSYFYSPFLQSSDVSLHGRVLSPSGEPIAGARISVGVLNAEVTSTTSGPDGLFEFPPLSSAIYSISAEKPGLVSDRRVLSLTAASDQQNFNLNPLPMLPDLQVANSTPAFIQPSDPLEGAEFKVFDGSEFSSDLKAIDPNKMTIVLTHGWNSSSSYWPLDLARIMAGNRVLTIANIVAWEWDKAAHALLPPEEKTPKQGLALGKALYSTLHENYARPIHFLGHSLGALVNARAANYLHGDKVDSESVPLTHWSPANTQMTLFDEAELARLGGKTVLFAGAGTYLCGLPGPVAAAIALEVAKTGWKTPIPKSSAWIDNYISLVGLYHPEAVNIALDKSTQFLDLSDLTYITHLLTGDFERLVGSLQQMHNYGYQLYELSIGSALDSEVFFRHSFEAQLLALEPSQTFPPIATELNAPASYKQAGASQKDIVVEQAETGLLSFQINTAKAVFGNYVVDSFEQGGTKVGQAVVSASETAAIDVSQGFNWTVDRVAEGAGDVVDLVNKAAIRVVLATGFPVPAAANRPKARDEAETQTTNTPSFISLPIAVPTGSVGMLFDFIITGEPKEDSIVCGVDMTNLFSLQAKFLPPGEVSTSSLIDISSYAGTTNDIFFGILGGTSTNCTVQIDSIRFYSFAVPQLEIATSGTILTLHWPLTAGGYIVETTLTLDSPAWETITNAPAISGDRYVLTNSWSESSRFFRLRQR